MRKLYLFRIIVISTRLSIKTKSCHYKDPNASTFHVPVIMDTWDLVKFNKSIKTKVRFPVRFGLNSPIGTIFWTFTLFIKLYFLYWSIQIVQFVELLFCLICLIFENFPKTQLIIHGNDCCLTINIIVQNYSSLGNSSIITVDSRRR